MGHGLFIAGPKVDAEQIALLSGAIVDVLTVCADKRIPEGIMHAALEALRQGSTCGPVNVTNCSFSDERAEVLKRVEA